MKNYISIPYDHYDSWRELSESDQVLVQKAYQIAETAYAPYSEFHVGSVVELMSGELVLGSNQENIAFLRAEIQGKQVMISGNSGVGKTTLVNALDSTLNLRTGEISQVHEQGKHTTTFAEMHALQSGGYIIDTPGIRAFGLVDLDKEHYKDYFPEMRELIGECRFHNCKHLNEPHCAVKQAVESSDLAESRYQSYVQLMLEDENDPYRRNEFV